MDGEYLGSEDGYFKPKHQLNKGRAQLTIEEKQAREMNVVEYMRICNKYLYSQPAELEAALADPTTPIFDIIVIRTLLIAAKKGSMFQIEFILNRMMGKPKQTLEIKPAMDTGTVDVVIQLPDNGRSAGGSQSS